jgi:hypothetical protein
MSLGDSVQETVQKHLASATKKLVDEAAVTKMGVDLLIGT